MPNCPDHVVQRGHNRQAVFAVGEDYQRYLADLRELKDVFGVKVYAYCLMTSHVHLLLAPGDSIAGLGQLMKALATRATRYRNRLEGRPGTLCNRLLPLALSLAATLGGIRSAIGC